jgi:hypothetical protein
MNLFQDTSSSCYQDPLARVIYTEDENLNVTFNADTMIVNDFLIQSSQIISNVST